MEGLAVMSRVPLFRWSDFLRTLAILGVFVLSRPEPAGARKEPFQLPAPEGRSLSTSSPTPMPTLTVAGEDPGSVAQGTPLTPVVPGLEPAEFPEAVRPKAVARYEGTPAPGLQVLLTSEGSTGADAQVRWVQTQGPPVVLDDPMVRTARLTVPEGATGSLGFLLVVGNAKGVDTAALTIPIEARSRVPRDPTLLADAGDPQVGLVGRMVTLNAIRSEPRGRIGYRWIQVGGPTIKLKIEDSYTYSFIPPAPGIYRFALVVAAGSEISEPAKVSVTVAAAVPTADLSYATAGTPPGAASVEPMEELARAALAGTDGGPRPPSGWPTPSTGSPSGWTSTVASPMPTVRFRASWKGSCPRTRGAVPSGTSGCSPH
jgi:hypothetical protein